MILIKYSPQEDYLKPRKLGSILPWCFLRVAWQLGTETDNSAGIRRTVPKKMGARWPNWLEHEFTDRKIRGSNPISASRLPLSRLG
ncbi:hypothetical protein CSKR_105535 [Clonorchis sinensis]|uniref:Uncharacterized protein n=1 Tax=Clonorchis sinensis TaxID=79923 RepID=A0A419QEZ8_CLOSI|nr:hypothetical protein CSKR_105535 [Clonorchis sinensis]